MDRWRLHNIERGKAYKGKNPHLLARDHINGISNYIGCDPKELIFGSSEERIDFIKLVLLGVIMNGDKHYYTKETINPFLEIRNENNDNEEFFRIALLNINDESLLKKLKELHMKKNEINYHEVSEKLEFECRKWYREYFGFFTNPINFENMGYLLSDDFDNELELPSNLLISLLFGDPNFSWEFMDGRFNSDNISSNVKENLTNLVDNKGQFGGFAIDWKERVYSAFIKAFNSVWERNGYLFLNYFEDNLFNMDLEANGLKNLDDDFIQYLIINPSFQNILYKIMNEERSKLKTMIGHKIADNYLEKYRIKLEAESDNLLYQSRYTLYKYNHDILKLTESFMEVGKPENNDREKILLHINVYLEVVSFNEFKKSE